MQYSYLNGQKISKLTLGTVAMGKDYGISNKEGKPPLNESRYILSHALHQGINCIDTANDYGNAEQIIGTYLEDVPQREPVNVVTKFKISPSALSDTSLAKEEAYASIRSSLRLLKTDRLAVCLFHKTIDQDAHSIARFLPGLFAELQQDGLVDICGVSVYHPDELNVFLDYPILQAFQSPMNVFDQRLLRNGALQRVCAEKKILFIRSVFLQGLFFMHPEELKGTLTAASGYLRMLRNIAEEKGLTVAQLAFSFLRDIEGIASLVFGAVHPDQVDQNIGWLDTPPLDRFTRQKLEDVFSEVPEKIIMPGLWTL